MAFLIGGANTLDDAYEISNSLRFNDDDSPSLSRANDSGGSNTTGTLSFWAKRCEINTSYLFYARSDDSNVFNVYFSNAATSRLEIRSTQGGSTDFQYKTNMKFRDPAAWYHVVIAIDTTDGTAADRCKLFVNGSRITSFETQTNFDQNDTIELFQSDATVYVGGEFEGGTIGSNTNDGYIADLNFVDGTQYDASYFGKTNANGVWVPKKFTGTQGTNGFRLEFQQTGTSANASGMGADTSGNGNHLTPSNLAAGDVTTDTPTNNFATLNPLNSSANATLSEGNTKHTNDGGNDQASAATMGFANGKWYWEIKCVDKAEVGINLNSDILQLSNDSSVGFNDANVKATALVTNSAGGSNDLRHNGSNESITSVSVSDNDIINIAVDADNGKIWFGKAGTWFGSGDPAAGSNESKDFSGEYTSGNFITPVGLIATGDGDIYEANFGNPSFSISSGNADGNGYGNFEYAVPSGFYALCTKNLAEYG